MIRFSAVSKSRWSRLPADIVTLTGHIVHDTFLEADRLFWSKWKLPYNLLFKIDLTTDPLILWYIHKCNYLKILWYIINAIIKKPLAMLLCFRYFAIVVAFAVCVFGVIALILNSVFIIICNKCCMFVNVPYISIFVGFYLFTSCFSLSSIA
jgi:hypothetical protein